MPHVFRVGLIVAVLLLWVVAGPVAAAFGECAAMGAMCEGPCGVHASALVPPPPSRPLLLSVSHTSHTREQRPLMFVAVLELPPK